MNDSDVQGIVIIGYGGGYMMTHRQDILETFENAFQKKAEQVSTGFKIPKVFNAENVDLGIWRCNSP